MSFETKLIADNNIKPLLPPIRQEIYKVVGLSDY